MAISFISLYRPFSRGARVSPIYDVRPLLGPTINLRLEKVPFRCDTPFDSTSDDIISLKTVLSRGYMRKKLKMPIDIQSEIVTRREPRVLASTRVASMSGFNKDNERWKDKMNWLISTIHWGRLWLPGRSDFWLFSSSSSLCNSIKLRFQWFYAFNYEKGGEKCVKANDVRLKLTCGDMFSCSLMGK
jgi:hypothetical protein